jgi:hypothetical protein
MMLLWDNLIIRLIIPIIKLRKFALIFIVLKCILLKWIIIWVLLLRPLLLLIIKYLLDWKLLNTILRILQIKAILFILCLKIGFIITFIYKIKESSSLSVWKPLHKIKSLKCSINYKKNIHLKLAILLDIGWKIKASQNYFRK